MYDHNLVIFYDKLEAITLYYIFRKSKISIFIYIIAEYFNKSINLQNR